MSKVSSFLVKKARRICHSFKISIFKLPVDSYTTIVAIVFANKYHMALTTLTVLLIIVATMIMSAVNVNY